jgi:pimeloyl-ACP methyl ester carboxylesterase
MQRARPARKCGVIDKSSVLGGALPLSEARSAAQRSAARCSTTTLQSPLLSSPLLSPARLCPLKPPKMAHPGIAHKYTSKLIAFEHTPHPSPSPAVAASTSTLLWIGGLGDGLLTVPYPSAIAASLPPTWRIAEVLLSSSYRGWGTSSLARDAAQLSACVAYFRALRPRGRVVLMGHSTGCQDIMAYVTGAGHAERPRVDGAVLQGSVSDREAWDFLLESGEEKEACARVYALAQQMVKEGKEKEIVPREGNILQKELGAPMSAYRTVSLLAPGGDDDFFSTDLSDEVLASTFGKIPPETPVCFLLGSLDPFVAPETDREALVARWTAAVRQGGGVVDDVHGGIVEGAHHNLDDDDEAIVMDLVNRVCGFLGGLDKGAKI